MPRAGAARQRHAARRHAPDGGAWGSGAVPPELAAAVKERKSPASFDDHYSQARLFFRSLTPVDQDHVVQAYTFELGKCREETVRQRQLLALANIDPALCTAVASGLGMPAPQASESVEDADPSPAVSQMGGSWPVAGRVVGIIAGADSDLDSVRAALATFDSAGIVPLVIAPTGGFLGRADGGIPVQRTYLTARSTEFDAIPVAASGAPARDAAQGRDAKAGQPEASLHPRLELLLSEMFRHAKAIGGWGPAVTIASTGRASPRTLRASPWGRGPTTSWRSSPGCSLSTGSGNASRRWGSSTPVHPPAAGG